MVIAILCNIKKPKSVLLQLMLGLECFAYGLKDTGLHVLNMFGITCSIKTVRKRAATWSKSRKCVDEMDKRSFWRVTIDNLNFKRKFAKIFQNGGDVRGRMLNLITGHGTCYILTFTKSPN